MSKLILPPIAEVRGIVLDMMPTIQPDADAATVQQSIELAENLVSLFGHARGNSAIETVLKTMLCAMATSFDDIDLVDELVDDRAVSLAE